MAVRYGTLQFLLKSAVVRYAFLEWYGYSTLVRYSSRCEVRSTQILNVPYRTAILSRYKPENVCAKSFSTNRWTSCAVITIHRDKIQRYCNNNRSKVRNVIASWSIKPKAENAKLPIYIYCSLLRRDLNIFQTDVK